MPTHPSQEYDLSSAPLADAQTMLIRQDDSKARLSSLKPYTECNGTTSSEEGDSSLGRTPELLELAGKDPLEMGFIFDNSVVTTPAQQTLVAKSGVHERLKQSLVTFSN